MSRYQENTRHKRMWFGTQHHSEWITCPLRGAEMTPESWGTEGTYLSGGGFVRQSQDSHRQYIFEWSGASSRASAETMQAYRDGVYNKTPSDLLYFIDPLTYSRNILPKRWAQPGILTKPREAEYSSIGVVAPVDTPVSLLGKQRVPMVGAQVSSPIGSLNDLLQRTSPGVGAIWVPIPEGETLTVIAWTGNPATSESGLYLKAQTSGGTWRSAEMVGTSGVIVSDAKGVLLTTVGTFDYYGARAIIGRGDDWKDPVVYEWEGTPNDSKSSRTSAEGTVTNLFTNPDMVAGSGSVPVFEGLSSPVWRGDPDLVEVENADGTFSYFGTPVEGLTALRGVVVKSSQWSKSGGVSARFITTSEATGNNLPIGIVGVSGSPVSGAVVWRRQDAPIGEFEFPTGASNLSILTGAGDASAPAVNAPGETLMRIELGEIAPNGVQVYLPGGGNVGDSVWFDIPTITDTEGYDGPPFSGSSASEGPAWLPGSGNSGCKIVGNPTWIANSGVNGGQIGYAATLKEVGDWQFAEGTSSGGPSGYGFPPYGISSYGR